VPESHDFRESGGVIVSEPVLMQSGLPIEVDLEEMRQVRPGRDHSEVAASRTPVGNLTGNGLGNTYGGIEAGGSYAVMTGRIAGTESLAAGRDKVRACVSGLFGTMPTLGCEIWTRAGWSAVGWICGIAPDSAACAIVA
jgi:hypothetical protein